MKVLKGNMAKVIAYLLTAVVCIFMFFTMLYPDNLINSQQGYDITNSIMNGTFANYFNVADWSYGMSVYFIYAIWSIPVWLVFHIMDITQPMNDFIPVLLWYKLLLVVFGVWSAYLVCKIVGKIEGDKWSDSIQHYITNPMFVLIIFAIVQCDIMGVCFVLLGIYYCITGDKRWKYILAFAVAGTMKYLSFFAIIPIIIYKEKRVLRIITSMLGSVSFTVLSKVILGFSEAASAAAERETFYVNEHMNKFSDYVISLGSKDVGWFAIAIIGVCILAWVSSKQDEKIEQKGIIWFAMAGYMAFCLFYPIQPYWNILLVPCFIILARLNKRNLKINLFLEIAVFVPLIICFACQDYWVILDINTYQRLFLRDFGRFVDHNLLVYFFEEVIGFDWKSYLPLFRGVEYVSAIMFMVINYPRANEEVYDISREEKLDINILQWMKIAVLYGMVGISLISLFGMYEDAFFDGKASVVVRDEGDTYEGIGCNIVSGLWCLDGGVWMEEEMWISIYTHGSLETDLMFSTYGYAMSDAMKIEVYVNDAYVGDLQREDTSANTTVRKLELPKEYFDAEERQVIKLKAEPQAITYNDEEVWISHYMYSIDLVAK